MFGARNYKLRNIQSSERVAHYTIKHLSIGTVSVAVAFGVLMLGATPRAYAESVTNTQITSQGSSQTASSQNDTDSVSEAFSHEEVHVDGSRANKTNLTDKTVTKKTEAKTETTTTTANLDPKTNLSAGSSEVSLSSSVNQAKKAGVKTKQTCDNPFMVVR